MALIDDINALPTTVGDGQTGHLANHQVIHSALKNHESRITSGTAYVDNRVPSTLAMRLDTSVGTRIFAGTRMIYGDTGWRDISGSLREGWTGVLKARRIGDMVTIRGLDISIGTSTSIVLAYLPAGFLGSEGYPLSAYTSGSTFVYARIFNNIVQLDRTTEPTLARDLGGTYLTSDPWPTSLPGTPA